MKGGQGTGGLIIIILNLMNLLLIFGDFFIVREAVWVWGEW